MATPSTDKGRIPPINGSSPVALYQKPGIPLIKGIIWGTAQDSQDTLEFSALTGVRPTIEKHPLSGVAHALEQMHSGKVRFRIVLSMGA